LSRCASAVVYAVLGHQVADDFDAIHQPIEELLATLVAVLQTW
jgi:hypothetical protein